MNISSVLKRKGIKIVIIIFFILLSITAFYFLFIKNQQETVWFSENWSYRKALLLDIPSKFYNLEQDILVELDTETIISEGKMQNDCRDIRFVDEDNSTRLKYWIEGGCNTKKTQIWVNMRLPESTEKTLYIYYGNQLAPDAQEEWGGYFITMSLEECKNNWRLDNNFQGKTALGSTEYGESNSIEYKIDELLEKNNDSICRNKVYTLNEPLTEKCNLNEDNILNNFLISPFNLNSFIPVNFCNSTNGYLNSNSISMIDTKTPTGWIHISEIDNKIPVGKDNLKIYEISNDDNINCKNKNLYDSNGTEKYLTLKQSPPYSFIQTKPPSYTLNFISPINDGPMITDMIVLASEVPPMGWDIYEELKDLFVKGSRDTKSETVGADIVSQRITLNFSQKSSTTSNIKNLETKEICLDDFQDNQINININPTPPPYIKTLFIKRKDTNIATSTDMGTVLPNDTRASSTTDDFDSLNTNNSKIQITIDDEEKKEDFIDDGEVLGATTPTSPDGLLVEGETNPTTVSDPTPEFSAIYNDPDTEDTSSNYQINVNTSSDFTGTVMWDSGKMTMTTTDEGNRSPDISYSGSTLSEGTTYYWRIKFWDSDDNESPWSATANFSLSSTPIASELLTCGNDDPDYITDNLTFSALYTDPGNTDATYYEIEVNTESNFGGTVKWDSGKTSTSIVSENRSPDYVYNGTTISNDGTTYYIRLRFWDGTDTVSDWVTGEFTDTLKGFRFDGLNLNGIKID